MCERCYDEKKNTSDACQEMQGCRDAGKQEKKMLSMIGLKKERDWCFENVKKGKKEEKLKDEEKKGKKTHKTHTKMCEK